MEKSRKTIGILAGMGPRSTARFLNVVLDECEKQYGAKYDDEFPHMMIYSLPTPFYLYKPVNQEDLKRSVCEGVKRLEETGVDFIVIPCGSVHAFFNEISASVHVPVLNMVNEVVKEVPQDISSLALIATKIMHDSGLYQDALKARGSDIVETTDLQPQINGLIRSAKSHEPMEKLLERYQGLVKTLAERGATGIIIACTDLSDIAATKNQVRTFDAGKILAKATVSYYLSGLGIV